MDSVFGPSFLAAPLRSESAAEGVAVGAHLASLEPCWQALTSSNPTLRAAALTTVSHYRSRTFFRRVVADPKGWSDPGARALYLCGFEALARDPIRRVAMLQAVAEDLKVAKGDDSTMLYAVFHAILRPDLDPGAPPPLPNRRWLAPSIAQALALEEERCRKAVAATDELLSSSTSHELEVLSESGLDDRSLEIIALDVEPRLEDPIDLAPSITPDRSAALARCLIVALSEVTSVWAVALCAEGGRRAQARALRVGLGLTPPELVGALRALGARFLELGRSIAAGERLPMTLDRLWSASLELGPVALPKALPEAERLLAATAMLCPWWCSIPEDEGLALSLLFEHPLWASLSEVILRRAERFEAPGSAAEAQVAAALALAQGLGGMPALEGAIERAIANAAGIIVPWSARPKSDRDLRWLRAEWQPTLARAFANADFTGWRYETWQSAELVLKSWETQEPIRLGLGSWAVIAILGAGAISYFVVLLTSILGAAG